ncbi:hypothetical protein CROQUDRAFT_458980 [Cronartium quercuum f. sp. fusiforme G11]|uniref:Uncharacterized protein n=1 Tax=Cronartium quercuum f. sp. fusiforme G11 TaxID=708437 RepID=A0A9P6NIG0_9BASI|nr:hypothetical protein CROQUDRAFT_458980 [Cronartium quercuum f. sp. fusiforme G11]
MSSIPFSFRPPNTGTSSSFSELEVEDQYRLTPPEEPIFDPHFLNFFGLVAPPPPPPPTAHSDSHHHQHHHHHQQPEVSWTGDPFRPVFNESLSSSWNPDVKGGKAMGDGQKAREEWTWER